PPSTSPIMDLGKMLAKLELVEGLQDGTFHVWRETRGGLTSYPPDPAVARGHLAATVTLQMQLRPHIVHIVGHTEAHHATTAAEIGLMDAPHLRGNAAACGKIVTRMIGGACVAVDGPTGKPIPETERVARALSRAGLTAKPARRMATTLS